MTSTTASSAGKTRRPWPAPFGTTRRSDVLRERFGFRDELVDDVERPVPEVWVVEVDSDAACEFRGRCRSACGEEVEDRLDERVAFLAVPVVDRERQEKTERVGVGVTGQPHPVRNEAPPIAEAGRRFDRVAVIA